MKTPKSKWNVRCQIFHVKSRRHSHRHVRRSPAMVAFPDGFGTMDEFFGVVTLIQTNKTPSVPIALVGSDFWNPMLPWCRETLLADEKISPEDMDLFKVVDTAAEAMAHLDLKKIS